MLIEEQDASAFPRRSHITRPGYRAGMDPPNKGMTFPAEVLSRDEVHALLGECSRRGSAGIRNRALIVLLYRTGLRISEALALERKDVDVQQGTVAVLHGKGDRRRIVGIDDQALAVLADWLERRADLGIRGGPIFCVFSGPTKGKRMLSSYFREVLKDMAVAVGIEKRVHPHGLRHTHAAELAREGVPLHVVRRQLGHADLATTARYIDHLSNQDVVDAMRAREDWTHASIS